MTENMGFVGILLGYVCVCFMLGKFLHLGFLICEMENDTYLMHL